MERRLAHSVSLQKPTVWLRTYIRKVVRILSCVKYYGRKRHQVACTFPDPVPLGQHVYIPHIWGKIMKEAIIKKLYPVSHSQYGSSPLPSVGIYKLVFGLLIHHQGLQPWLYLYSKELLWMTPLSSYLRIHPLLSIHKSTSHMSCPSPQEGRFGQNGAQEDLGSLSPKTGELLAFKVATQNIS